MWRTRSWATPMARPSDPQLRGGWPKKRPCSTTDSRGDSRRVRAWHCSASKARSAARTSGRSCKVSITSPRALSPLCLIAHLERVTLSDTSVEHHASICDRSPVMAEYDMERPTSSSERFGYGNVAISNQLCQEGLLGIGGAAGSPSWHSQSPRRPMMRVTEPHHYATDALLRDGSSIHIRAIRPDDKQRLLALFERLSSGSIYFRFFQTKQRLTDEELRYFTELDFTRDVALVATRQEGQEEHIIGVGRYFRIHENGQPTTHAEVAFTVADAHQGRGVGTLLLEHLAAIARAQG